MGPFADFKATEISQENQKEFFVKPKFIKKLYAPKASFIFGERGSGKTTILKYLEQYFNENTNQWVAVYYRFETASMKSLYNARLDEDENIENFSQIIHAILCKLLCQKLIERKCQHIFKEEKEICKSVLALMANQNEIVESFEQLKEVFEKIRLQTLFGIRNKESKMLFDYNNIFQVFVECLKRENGFEKLGLCFLLDEYENLTVLQQRVINSMVKDSSEMINFKICLRPQGFWTRETLAKREHLLEKDDFINIDYVKDIMGDEADIQELMRKVCANRLTLFYKNHNYEFYEKDVEIDNYLEVRSIEKELEEIEGLDLYKNELIKAIIEKAGTINENKIKVFSDILDLQLFSILLEKEYKFDDLFKEFINKSSKYKHWVHNYKINAFYIILDECGSERKYGGFDIIVKLTNYNVRMVLTILNYIFEKYDFSNGCRKKITINKQHKAICTVAAHKFNQISFIPVHGYEVKNFINALGNLFRIYILDKRAKKFEVNNFTIKATEKISIDKSRHVYDILKDAVIWGVLLERDSNKIKNRLDYSYDRNDYILHPIYAVHFNISYRTKQKCYLDDEDVMKMFQPMSNKEIGNLLAKEKRDRNIPGQLKLPINEFDGD